MKPTMSTTRIPNAMKTGIEFNERKRWRLLAVLGSLTAKVNKSNIAISKMVCFKCLQRNSSKWMIIWYLRPAHHMFWDPSERLFTFQIPNNCNGTTSDRLKFFPQKLRASISVFFRIDEAQLLHRIASYYQPDVHRCWSVIHFSFHVLRSYTLAVSA